MGRLGRREGPRVTTQCSCSRFDKPSQAGCRLELLGQLGPTMFGESSSLWPSWGPRLPWPLGPLGSADEFMCPSMVKGTLVQVVGVLCQVYKGVLPCVHGLWRWFFMCQPALYLGCGQGWPHAAVCACVQGPVALQLLGHLACVVLRGRLPAVCLFMSS